MEPLGVPSAKPHSSPSSPGSCSSLPVLSLPAQREVLVPGDLAQPHPQLAVPRNWSMEANARKKVSWVYLLRRVGVPAEGQDVAVHVGEIRLIDLLKIARPPSSLP